MALIDSKKRRIENAEEVEDLSLLKIKHCISLMDNQKMADFISESALKYQSIFDDLNQFVENDPDNRKLFLRSLSYNTTDEELHTVMSEFGELSECVIVRENKTDKSKRYAFVTFKNKEDADAALALKQIRIDNRDVFIHLASERNFRCSKQTQGQTFDQTFGNKSNPEFCDNEIHLQEDFDEEACKLFVHGLAWKTNSDVLREHFEPFGRVHSAVVTYNKQTRQSKGFGFVTFCSPESAQKALIQSAKSIDGRSVRCHYASERQRQSPRNNFAANPFISQQTLAFANQSQNSQFNNYQSSSMAATNPYQQGQQSNDLQLYPGGATHVGLDLQMQLQQLQIVQAQLAQRIVQQQQQYVNGSNCIGQDHSLESQQQSSSQQQPFFNSQPGSAVPVGENRQAPKNF